MLWAATGLIGVIVGSVILFIGIAIGRQLGEAERGWTEGDDGEQA